MFFFFFQAEDGIRDKLVTGVQTCALPILQCKNALAQGGKYVSVDGGMPWPRAEYLVRLRQIIEEGHFRAVIDRCYPLEQIVEAHRYVDKGHKKGNVVITVGHSNKT